MANTKSVNAKTKTKDAMTKKAAVPLQDSLDSLAKFGGFAILKNTIRTTPGKSGERRTGLDNLDPKRPAARNIFLTDPTYSDARKELKKRLQIWRDQIAENPKYDKLVSATIKRSEKLTKVREKNLKTALDATRELEKSYRTLASFFTNAEKSKGAKVEKVDIINASMEQLKDRDNPLYLTAISNQLEANYNKLDLMNNYSVMVVPGFLGSAQDVDRYAEVAYRHKVMLFTDFLDLDGVESVIDMLDQYQLTGAEYHKAYVCMTCNYLVGRGGFDDLDEPEMYIPPSAALAGRIYSNPTQVITAGKTHGRLKEVNGVRFNIKHTELGDIANKGVIPMTFDFGQVMPFGSNTLFDGDNPGYRTYSVVRTFDFITKSTKDLLNRFTFRLLDPNLTKDIRKQINKFLESNKGAGKLIEKFNIKSIEKIDVDKVRLNIEITPWFPARLFEINLTGIEGEQDMKNWEDEVTPA